MAIKFKELNESFGISEIEFVKRLVVILSEADDKNSLEDLGSPTHKINVETIEPYTAAWVALMLAEGALKWLGGKIMDKLFGSSSDAKIDLALLVKSILVGVSRIVKEEIKAEALRKAQSDLSALQMRFRHYNNAPSADRLYSATETAEILTSNFQRFELLGHHSFLIAVGIHIAVLQERVNLLGENEKLNLKEVLELAISHCELMHEAWKKWNYDSYRIVSETIKIPLFDGDSLGDTNYIWRTYTLVENVRTKQLLWKAETKDPLSTTQLNQKIYFYRNQGLAEIMTNHINPSKEVVAIWKELLSRLQ